jgi:hypothetical protein
MSLRRNPLQVNTLRPFAKSAGVPLNFPSDTPAEVDLDSLDIGIAKLSGLKGV